MRVHARNAVIVLMTVGLTFVGGSALAASDSHSSHDSGHSSGGKGGPKYGGGDRGSGHSTDVHRGGTHGGHDSAGGGSKSVESKVFGGSGRGGPQYMGAIPTRITRIMRTMRMIRVPNTAVKGGLIRV